MGHSIVHSCYTFQNAQEVNLSIGLRITAAVVGIFLAITGILILSNIPVINQLGTTAGWSMLAIGLFSVFLASAIKCVQKKSTPEIVKKLRSSTQPNNQSVPLKAEPKKYDLLKYYIKHAEDPEEDRDEIYYYDPQNSERKIFTQVKGGKIVALVHIPGFLAYSFYSPSFQNCVWIYNLETQEEHFYTNFKKIFFYEKKFLGLNADDDWELYSLTNQARVAVFSSIFETKERIVKVVIQEEWVIFLHHDPSSCLNLTLFSLKDLKVLKSERLTQCKACNYEMRYENGKLLIVESHDSTVITWQHEDLKAWLLAEPVSSSSPQNLPSSSPQWIQWTRAMEDARAKRAMEATRARQSVTAGDGRLK